MIKWWVPDEYTELSKREVQARIESHRCDNCENAVETHEPSSA
jgi:hypothetical protein